ncbi:MAG TPA: ornithine carbamoyltransferase [Gemmatimonadaceae bacterium]|nr:ornithine carbamoyltransferase [Gemmatimonadaceae bacterium]
MRPHRDFLTIADFTKGELDALFALAARMKAGRYRKRPLAGQALAMIFMKSSTRTRVSFEVGAAQLGAQPLFLSPRDVQLGRGEPVADTTRVLARMCGGIMIRTYAQAEAEEVARVADVPVINGLTDKHHPCQILADLLTVREVFGSYAGRRVAWIGDGNNVANSWLDAAYRLGFPLRLACPEGYEPDAALLARARQHADVTLTRDPREAAEGAHVVTTDVWASMGREAEHDERERAFRAFTVDDALMTRAAKDAIFLHCLPAHRGEEVAASVIDGPRSRVWDEAENRLHVQKAVMAALMGGEPLAGTGRRAAASKARPAGRRR